MFLPNTESRLCEFQTHRIPPDMEFFPYPSIDWVIEIPIIDPWNESVKPTTETWVETVKVKTDLWNESGKNSNELWTESNKSTTAIWNES